MCVHIKRIFKRCITLLTLTYNLEECKGMKHNNGKFSSTNLGKSWEVTDEIKFNRKWSSFFHWVHTPQHTFVNKDTCMYLPGQTCWFTWWTKRTRWCQCHWCWSASTTATTPSPIILTQLLSSTSSWVQPEVSTTDFLKLSFSKKMYYLQVYSILHSMWD